MYNLIPDAISRLSRDQARLPPDGLRSIMRFLLAFIQKERSAEALVYKLCQRFSLTGKVQQWRDLAYCLSQLALNDRSVRKMLEKEVWRMIAPALGDEEVFASFGALVAKARKTGKPEMRAGVDELETRLRQTYEVATGKTLGTAALPTSAPSNGGGGGGGGGRKGAASRSRRARGGNSRRAKAEWDSEEEDDDESDDLDLADDDDTATASTSAVNKRGAGKANARRAPTRRRAASRRAAATAADSSDDSEPELFDSDDDAADDAADEQHNETDDETEKENEKVQRASSRSTTARKTTSRRATRTTRTTRT